MLSVLLVEDDQVDREAARRALGEAFAVSDAHSVAEAVGELLDMRPDCLVLDYNLPDGDSFRLLDICRKQAIAAVLLTGEARTDLAVEALQKGAQDYLVKGEYSPVELRESVLGAVEKVALQRDLADQKRYLERSRQALEERSADLHDLASELTLAEVRERRSAAERLQNELELKLNAAKLILSRLRRSLSSEQREKVETVLAELDAAADAVGELSSVLNPVAHKSQDIEAALTSLADDLQRRYQFSTQLKLEGDTPYLDDAKRLLVYQLVGELLMNVIKHADVDEAELVLNGSADIFCAEIRDAGRGFKPEALERNWGLKSVRERLNVFGGRLVLVSAPGEGSRARLELPLKKVGL